MFGSVPTILLVTGLSQPGRISACPITWTVPLSCQGCPPNTPTCCLIVRPARLSPPHNNRWEALPCLCPHRALCQPLLPPMHRAPRPYKEGPSSTHQRASQGGCARATGVQPRLLPELKRKRPRVSADNSCAGAVSSLPCVLAASASAKTHTTFNRFGFYSARTVSGPVPLPFLRLLILREIINDCHRR